MQEYRIHGRGGQGVLTVGQLIALASFAAGVEHVQTFATFGGERRGAPVTAFVRVADAPIRRRCDVERPGVVLLFDPSFLQDGTGLAGLAPDAAVVINTAREPDAFVHHGPFRFATLDALGIARASGLDRIVNTAMLGAFCRVTGSVTLEQMEAAVRAQLSGRGEENARALHAAYARVRTARGVADSA